MYKKYFKRILDFCIALCGIVILWLPMLVIAVVIRIESKGSAIFKQERLGKEQKVFTVKKFRTMVENAYQLGGIATRSDDVRITRVGAFLRRTSLDELPQLFNIIKGEMAIIGPRPILPIEFEEYKENPTYCKRYSVRQGMFCTVDIKYRASCSRDLQFTMDAEYADNITFFGDVKTFLLIIKTVLAGKNVYREEMDKDNCEEKVETHD